MQTKTLDSLLEDANKKIKKLSFNETIEMLANTKSIIIDVREDSEVMNSGVIKNAIHIPRGVLEFKLAPNSLSNPKNIDENTNLLLYCAGGYRSALAGKTLLEIGFNNVYNIGGYGEWIDNGGDIQASP
tara:strand:- start:2721 stop:3107 length:387 start_codon:yes stop_codon:yes gene_type:complete